MIIFYKAEILELSGNYAKENKVKRITPRHFRLPVSLDQELNTVKNILQFNLDKTVMLLFFFLQQLLKQVIVPGAGVLPSVQKLLLRNDKKIKKHSHKEESDNEISYSLTKSYNNAKVFFNFIQSYTFN